MEVRQSSRRRKHKKTADISRSTCFAAFLSRFNSSPSFFSIQLFPPTPANVTIHLYRRRVFVLLCCVLSSCLRASIFPNILRYCYCSMGKNKRENQKLSLFVHRMEKEILCRTEEEIPHRSIVAATVHTQDTLYKLSNSIGNDLMKITKRQIQPPHHRAEHGEIIENVHE